MRLGRCPGCSNERDVDAQVGLLEAEATIVVREKRSSGNDIGDAVRRLACATPANWFWACDECVREGRGLVADATDVTCSMGLPFAGYVDRPFVCEDCGTDAIFSAREQKHWFEELRFLIWVYPKQCVTCRAKRRAHARANKELAQAIANLDASDPTQLEAVANLFDQVGSGRKAVEFRNRAKNRRR
jgi:hypothetical protein